MHFACWITKATDTHSEYVILIAIPWKRWFRERALLLRFTYFVLTLSGVFLTWFMTTFLNQEHGYILASHVIMQAMTGLWQ